MFIVKGPEAAVTTTSELKKNLKQTLEAARHCQVYVTKDGKPIAAIISMEMVDVLNEALEDRYLARMAGARFDAAQSGKEELLSEEEFWSRADAVMAQRTDD